MQEERGRRKGEFCSPGLAARAANPYLGAVRNAEARAQNDEHGRCGAYCSADEEINEGVVQAHGEEYASNESLKRGY